MDGAIDLFGNTILPKRFALLGSAGCGLFHVSDGYDQPTGFIDARGVERIPRRFRSVGSFDLQTGLCWVHEIRVGVDHYGMIDSRGQIVIPIEYANVSAPVSNGLLAVSTHQSKGLYGFVDLQNRLVIQAQYEGVGRFVCGLAPASTPDDLEHYHYINLQGEKVLGPFIGNAGWMHEFVECGLSIVKLPNERFACITTTGREIPMPPGLSVSSFVGSFAEARVIATDRVGFVNSNFEWVVDPIYDDSLSMRGEHAKVKRDGKWGLVDCRNQVVVAPSHASSGQISFPSCDRIMVAINTFDDSSNIRFGYRSLSTGKMVIPPAFRTASEFVDGMAVVGDGID